MWVSKTFPSKISKFNFSSSSILNRLFSNFVLRKVFPVVVLVFHFDFDKCLKGVLNPQLAEFSPFSEIDVNYQEKTFST
jgi:hypothetical protein